MTYAISDACLEHCLAGQMSDRDKVSGPQGYEERWAFPAETVAGHSGYR